MAGKLPRGIRNNNPGNIRLSKDAWQGLAKQQTDADFFRFETPTDGLRALMIILINYQRKHGLNTVRQMIGRWAPPNENNTDVYVSQVADAIGVQPDETIDLKKTGVMVAMTRAIVRHENGRPYAPFDLNWWYGIGIYVEAAKRALGN